MKVKRLLCVLLVIAVIASIAAVSFAAESRAVNASTGYYSAQIPFPSSGSGQVASYGIMSTGGFSPWFQSDITTIRTNYMLSTSDSIALLPTHRGTNIVSTGNAYYNSMTYLQGHGGSGITYYFVGAGAVASYEPYNIRGVWSPD